MRLRASAWLITLAFAFGANARAADFSFEGYADFRLVVPGKETGWLDGGLGKLRFGGNQPDPNFRFAEAIGQATLSLDDNLHFVAVGRLEPEQRSGIDMLEAYASYRPGLDGWNVTLRAGAFFPPFSLENTDIGWTSPYTLTPSAINSWVGDELRTIGVEARVERQTSIGTFALTVSLFCCNDPAGVLIADRGFTLDDRPTGLFENVREPDATLELFQAAHPDRTPLFLEIDDNVGWYAGATWSMAGIGKAAVYRYDNEANPAAHIDDYFAWRTHFWSFGWESHFGPMSFLAQGLTGDTAIRPFPGFTATTTFRSAYLLAAYDLDDWRVAARAEAFQTRAKAAPGLLDEDGDAFTFSASWTPKDWLRLTSEVIRVTSRRGERAIVGLSPTHSDTQFQLSVRILT
jgi:hypothetical protein